MRGHHNTSFHARKGRVSYRPLESQDGTKSTGKNPRVGQRRCDSQSTKVQSFIVAWHWGGGRRYRSHHAQEWPKIVSYFPTRLYPNRPWSGQLPDKAGGVILNAASCAQDGGSKGFPGNGAWGLPVGKQRGVGRGGNIIRTSTGGGAMSTEN